MLVVDPQELSADEQAVTYWHRSLIRRPRLDDDDGDRVAVGHDADGTDPGIGALPCLAVSDRTGEDPGTTRRPAPATSGLVDGYEDLVEVGRGGFGIVYRARQVEFDRTVALKILTGTFDEDARGRFERECRAMGSLSGHPNIVTVYAAGMTRDGRPYLAMEFLPSGSLGEQLDGRSMPWADAVTVGIRIAGALQTAHDIGVLHRDVKPDNILLSAYGQPKLGDFGIARLHGAYETRTGIVSATLAHAAPELLEGKPPSRASDVYSLASTTFSLIAGNPPFARDETDSLASVVARVATEPVPDLQARGVPVAVFRALEQGLAKDPEKRTPTAAKFGYELRDAARAAGAETAEMVVAPPVRPAAPTRRRRFVAIAVAVVAVLVAVGVTALIVGRGSGSSKRSSNGGTGNPTPASVTPNQAPAFPSQIPGYAREGAPVSLTTRAFAGQPNYIPQFPSTMNGCDQAVITTRWRSLGGNVTAGNADGHFNGFPPPTAPRDPQTGQAGLIQGNQCEEPVFFLEPGPLGSLVDVSVQYQVWRASP